MLIGSMLALSLQLRTKDNVDHVGHTLLQSNLNLNGLSMAYQVSLMVVLLQSFQYNKLLHVLVKVLLVVVVVIYLKHSVISKVYQITQLRALVLFLKHMLHISNHHTSHAVTCVVLKPVPIYQ